MRIVILNACKPDDEFAQRTLSGLAALLAESAEFLTTVDLNGKRIADCTGCFRCWTHTPGECTIKDDAPAITAELAKSDRIVFFCPVVFGGFSPDLKRVLERSISLLLPIMRSYRGEMHHPVRYGKHYELCGVGILDTLDPEAAASFKKRLLRLSLNYNGTRCFAGTIIRGDGNSAMRLRAIFENGETV
jgi:multimeric flavodoxin WrbA